MLSESPAIALLKSASHQAVADLLRLSWDEMHGIMERAVARRLKRRAAETIRHSGVIWRKKSSALLGGGYIGGYFL